MVEQRLDEQNLASGQTQELRSHQRVLRKVLRMWGLEAAMQGLPLGAGEAARYPLARLSRAACALRIGLALLLREGRAGGASLALIAGRTPVVPVAGRLRCELLAKAAAHLLLIILAHGLVRDQGGEFAQACFKL